MNRIFTRLGFTAAALVAGSGIIAHAQSSSTGIFTGKVSDSSGKPVAGAQVILSGPGLQGARTMVTGPDGSYRFPLTPSGTNYSIKVVAQSGGAQASGLGLDPWKTSIQNFTIKTAAAAGTTVEVIAAASNVTVDNTTTTDSKTYSAEILQSVPLAGRDWTTAAYLAPGVVDGGRGTANPNMGGGTAFENNYIVDGMNVTDPLLGTNNTRVNTLAVESVQVQSGGYEPEYGRATGGVISVVTKTGSNDFHADMEVTYRPESAIAKASAQGNLPFSSGRSSQGNQMTTSIWLGGPILKDKLWYSLGITSDQSNTGMSYGQSWFLDPDQATNNPLTLPSTSAQLGGLTNTGTSYDLKNKNLDLVGKLTYSLNTNHTLEFGFTRNRNTNDNSVLGLTTKEYESTWKNHQDVDIYSLNWRGVITPSWLIDVRVGTYLRKDFDDATAQYSLPYVGISSAPFSLSGQLLADGTTPLFPATVNATRANPGLSLGGVLGVGANDLTRKQWSIKGTNFFGNHILKYGLDYDETGYKSTSGYSGDFYATRAVRVNAVTGAPVYFQDTYRFRTGAGGTPVQRNDGTAILDGAGNPVLALMDGALLTLDSKTKNMAYFIQDSWQIHPRLLVIAGVRADSQTLYGGDGQQYLQFKGADMLAPRFGVTWDPWGDGKTKIQGSFGRFYETVPMDLNQRAGSAEGFVTFTSPANGNAFATNPANFYTVPSTSSIFQANHNLQAGYNLSRVIGGGKADIDVDNIKPQSIEEIAFGVERQVSALVKVGAKWKYRYYKNVIEDFSDDFGNTYWIGNPGQNGKGLAPVHVEEYDYPGQSEWITFPKPRRDYRELVLSVDKAKGGDAWALSTSLTFAINEGNFAGMDSPLNGQADPNITSTYDLPTLMRNTYGILPNSPRYNFQMNGSYDFGFGLMASARYSYRAGTAISAVGPDLGWLYGPVNYGSDYYMFDGQFVHGGNYGNNEALLEPRGSRGTTPDVSRLDLHVEWTYNLPMARKTKMVLFMDMFNVFNQQMALTVNQAKEYQAQVTGYAVDANGTAIVGGGTRTGFVAMPNPRFLQPTSFQAPRSIQLGARFHF
jgi:hypothetical protein